MGSDAWLAIVGGAGLLTCLAGYRLFMMALALLGAWVGGFLGLTVGSIMDSTLAMWVGTAVGAVSMAILARLAYRACVSLLGALLFGGTAAVLLLPLGPIAQAVGGFVAAGVGAGLAFMIQRTMIVLATAVQGALTAILAGVVNADNGSFAEYQYRFSLIVSGAESPDRVLGHPALLAAWGALAMVGIVVQVRSGRRPEPAD